MKIKSGFIVREIAGSHVAAATGEAAKNFNGIITLNETGRFLFSLLQNEMTEQELIDAMRENFDVDEKTAGEDVRLFVNKLKESNILE